MSYTPSSLKRHSFFFPIWLSILALILSDQMGLLSQKVENNNIYK